MRATLAIRACFATVLMAAGQAAPWSSSEAGAGVMISALGMSAAAAPHPVRWRVAGTSEPVSRRPGKLTATVVAEVAPGWHLYALDEPEDGPVPLAFSADPNGAVALMSVGAKRPLRAAVQGFAAPVAFYVGRVEFRLRLRMRQDGMQKAMQDAGPIELQVRYQACNERLCLPPRVGVLAVPLREPRAGERVR